MTGDVIYSYLLYETAVDFEFYRYFFFNFDYTSFLLHVVGLKGTSASFVGICLKCNGRRACYVIR